MAKGQYLSKHQQGIVKRYYEHADARVAAALQETLSDLYLAAPGNAADKLWKKLCDTLAKAGVDASRTGALLASRDIKAAAELVNRLTAPGSR